MTRRIRWAVCVLLGLSVGCADEPAPAPTAARSETLTPPATVDTTGAAWTGAEGDDAEVVARVGGVPVTRATLEALREAHPDRQPRELLDRLVELELLAQLAYRRGFGQRPEAVEAWRQALVQEYVHAVFETAYTPESIPLAEVQRVYRVPTIRQIYDHAPAWRGAHLHLDCCDLRVGQACGQDDRPVDGSVVSCFAEMAYLADEVYRDVKEALKKYESGDPETYLEAFKRYYGRVVTDRYAGKVSFERLRFYYHPDKPHTEQKGYTVISEAVARAIIDAPFVVLQPPVQSPFAWHIVVKLNHVPEERRGPDNPEVVEDIRQNAFPRFLHARFGRDLNTLLQRYQVSLRPEALELLTQRTGPGPPGPQER